MEFDTIRVQLLGEFSLTMGETRLDIGSRRPAKTWLLLAYLLFHRDRFISQEELIDRLWGSETNDNPTGTLKTTLWRTRQLLDVFGPSAGHTMILNKGNTYGWNPDIPTEVDVEQFETLCNQASAVSASAEKIEKYQAAVKLYNGGFLNRFSSEIWVEPISAYYYNIHIYAASELLSLLQVGVRTQEIVELCRAVLRTAPYEEVFYQYLMQALMDAQDYKGADAVYEEMRELLFTNLGILPDARSQALHQEILSHFVHHFLTTDMLQEQLREIDPAPGAFFCSFSAFRLFYQAEARSALRRGDTIHVCMMTVTGEDGKELPPHKLERVVMRLQEKLQSGLRRGDIIARCSTSQFAILLLQANYENSRKVCERLVQSFRHSYPQSPGRVQFTVMPLEPLQMQQSGEAPARWTW